MTRHRFDGMSFVAGVVLATLGLIWLVGPPGGFALQARLLATILMIGLGLGVLSTAWPREETQATGDPDATPDPEPD